MNETIEDIVAEIREAGKTWDRSEIAQLPTQYIKEWADRIEASMKQQFSDAAKMIPHGNEEKMREALEAISRIDTRRLKRLLCELVEADIFDGGQISRTISAVDKAISAIAAQPRNCDALSKDEALAELDSRSFSKEDTVEWLYSTATEDAKGDNNGRE